MAATADYREPDQRRGLGSISHRAAARLAWSLWALCLALTALSLLLLTLNLSYPGTHVYDYWLTNTTAVIDVTVGAIVASRRPENPVGWLVCLYSIAIGTSYFSSEYAIYALQAQPHSLPAGEVLVWISSWLLSITVGLQVFSLLLFPTGRLPSRRWRWLAWLTVAVTLIGMISSAFSSGQLDGLGPIRNPLGMDGFSDVYDVVRSVMFPLLFLAVASSLFARLRRAVGVERQQLKWLAYAAATFAVGIILLIIPGVIDTPPWFERAGVAIFVAAGAGIPISMGIAILRYRLYNIDLIINRTLVYGSLTVTLALVYLCGVAATEAFFRALTGQEQQTQLAIVVSTLVIAALFTPLRRRIQGFIDRIFYRRKYDAVKTLEAFSAKLRNETDLDALSEDLTSAVGETLQPTHVSLWLRPMRSPRRSIEPSERLIHPSA
jgi:hypothetical protein